MFHDRLKRSDHKIELTQGCNGRARQTSPGLLDINAAADGPLSEEEAKQHRLRALELHRRRSKK